MVLYMNSSVCEAVSSDELSLLRLGVYVYRENVRGPGLDEVVSGSRPREGRAREDI